MVELEEEIADTFVKLAKLVLKQYEMKKPDIKPPEPWETLYGLDNTEIGKHFSFGMRTMTDDELKKATELQKGV